jgi:hypothetical protein
MNIQDESVFDDRVRAVLPDALPPEVEGRLQTQLAEFRTRLHDREAAIVQHDRGLDRSGRRGLRHTACAYLTIPRAGLWTFTTWACRGRRSWSTVCPVVISIAS